MSDLHDGSAWRDFCGRLLALGERLQGEEFPADPRARAEGYRALVRLLVYATQQEIEAGDPRFPGFVRHQDPWNQWGGPNPDNVYLRANVDARQRYRVWSRDVRGLRQAIFSLHEGDMQLEQYGVFGERSLPDLGVGADGALELRLVPQGDPDGGPNAFAMDPKARIFTIRLYQADWQRDAVPTFHIEREGGEGEPTPVLAPEALATGLDRAMRWVEASAHYWNRYTGQGWAHAKPNEAAAPRGTPGGADNIRYGSCFWDLAPAEALLLEVERPEADYWSFVTHTLHWLESGSFDTRQTSLNGEQAHVDPDGVVRVVVAHRDPGVPNWIDTEERRRGMLIYRWVWARTNPCPSARVLPLSGLHEALPDGHPEVSPEARRAALARRREAVWRRYR